MPYAGEIPGISYVMLWSIGKKSTNLVLKLSGTPSKGMKADLSELNRRGIATQFGAVLVVSITTDKVRTVKKNLLSMFKHLEPIKL